MEIATAKDELKLLLEQQPEDSSSEELVRELALHIMIKKGQKLTVHVSTS
jgi:hypothetical protein